MSIKFWLGGAKSDRSRQLIKYILDEAEAHPDRHYLFVAPEQFGLAAQRELVLNSKNHGILNIDVLSFTRLAHRISDEVGSYEADVTMLGETGKSLIIGMLANGMRDELTVFGKDIDRLGYIDRFKSVISEFMQYGITVDKAFEMAQSAKSAGRGQLAAKLNDVAVVYKAFREYIKDRYTTVEETLAYGLVGKRYYQNFLRVNMLFLNQILDFCRHCGCFASSGTGNYQCIVLVRQDDFPLLFIQIDVRINRP